MTQRGFEDTARCYTMKIESFNRELNRAHPGAYATVENNAKGNRQVSVTVWYGADGKGYTYKGTIHAVAERLGLIPNVHAGDEANRIASLFSSGAEEVVGFACASDTLRWMGIEVGHRPAGQDEFDRDIVEFYRG